MTSGRPARGTDLDQWASGISPDEASLAWALVGLARKLDPFASSTDTSFLRWKANTAGLPQDPRSVAASAHAAGLADPYWPDRPRSDQRPLRRLALGPQMIPTEVMSRLLSCPGVDSVVAPVSRPPGATPPHTWGWPFRIGVISRDDDEALASAVQAAGYLPPELVDLRDVRVEPGAVDLLVVESTLRRAIDDVTRLRQAAGAVLVVTEFAGPWPALDAQLAHLRARTGASVTALVDPDAVGPDIAPMIGTLLRCLSHAMPLDVALTFAAQRQLLLAGELDRLSESSLPDTIRLRARSLDRMAEALPESIGPDDAGALPSADDLGVLAEGRFDAEIHEASVAEKIFARIDRATGAAQAARFLQAYVGPSDRPVDSPPPAEANVLRAGPNAVDIFIGPAEEAAISWVQVNNQELGLTAGVDEVEITVILVPLIPRGEPVTGHLVVPKVGRSSTARLPLDIPDGTDHVEARIIALHGNRVLQTSVLSGRVDGAPASISSMVVLRQDLATLDQRRDFDQTFLLNMATDGTTALIAHSNGNTTIDTMDEVSALTKRIRELLIEAAYLRGKPENVAEQTRQLLIKLALRGNDLYVTLKRRLTRLGGDPRRIQIVTARPGHFLPLELVYPRRSPAKDAKLCPKWLAGGDECHPDKCFTDDKDISVICPAMFWGLSKVIERHYLDIDSQNFLVLAEPTTKRRTLPVTRAVLGASKKVKDAEKIRTSLGPSATLVNSWKAWVTAIESQPDLLMLLPHTEKETLEISGEFLDRAYIEREHVTGEDAVTPVVVLFGCDTSGSQEEPGGYATRFMEMNAAVVFSSLTMLLNSHAAHLSTLLAATLLANRPRKQPLGDLVTEFRRTALLDGTLAALAITAYGDADWNV